MTGRGRDPEAEVGQPEIERLAASSPAALAFDRSLAIRAFVLRRERGNLLVYAVPERELAARAIADAGGVAAQYLNHRHEAMVGAAEPAAPLRCHERERAAVERTLPVAETFGARAMLDDDFELIPTPGHTPGATAFLWDSGRGRLLFTGDTIYLREGEWVAAVLGSSDRDAYVASLELLRELDFDVLVPWAATAGGPWAAATDRADARRRLDAVLTRVRSGASS